MLIEYEIKGEARLKASSQADRDCQEGVDSDRNAMFCALSADVDKYGGVYRTLILYPIKKASQNPRARAKEKAQVPQYVAKVCKKRPKLPI